jgi:hypothetical protein
MDKMVMDIRLVKYTPSSALIKHPEIKSKFLEKPFFFVVPYGHIFNSIFYSQMKRNQEKIMKQVDLNPKLIVRLVIL